MNRKCFCTHGFKSIENIEWKQENPLTTPNAPTSLHSTQWMCTTLCTDIKSINKYIQAGKCWRTSNMSVFSTFSHRCSDMVKVLRSPEKNRISSNRRFSFGSKHKPMSSYEAWDRKVGWAHAMHSIQNKIVTVSIGIGKWHCGSYFIYGFIIVCNFVRSRMAK